MPPGFGVQLPPTRRAAQLDYVPDILCPQFLADGTSFNSLDVTCLGLEIKLLAWFNTVLETGRVRPHNDLPPPLTQSLADYTRIYKQQDYKIGIAAEL